MAWVTKDVQLVLRTGLVLEMFQHAERFDVEKGGRYDRRGAAIVIWSASFTAALQSPEPQGEARFWWRTPTEGQATLYRISWDLNEGGSEAVVWEALEVLAGRSLRPDAP